MPIIRTWRLRDVIALCWYFPWLQEGGHVRLVGSASMDALPTNLPTYQPTYQHKAITSRSRQLLMIGTWLPETCWATIRREIEIQKVTSSWFFLSTHNVVPFILFYIPQKKFIALLTPHSYRLHKINTDWQDLLSTPMCDLRNYWTDSMECGVGSLVMIITKKRLNSNAIINQHSNY